MAWTNLTYATGSLLTAAKMVQLDENLDAMAAGNAGAPALAVNSFVATGVGSHATLNVSSGYQSLQVGSFGSVNVSSGFRTTQVGSFGAIHANSPAPAAPVAGVFYKDSAIRAWAVCSDNGSIYSSMGIASVSNPTLEVYGITLATSFNTARSWAHFIAHYEYSLDKIELDPGSSSGGVCCLFGRTIGGAAAAVAFTFMAVGS